MGTNSRLNRPKPGTQGSSHGQSARFQADWKKEKRKIVTLLEGLYRRRLTLKEKRNEIREERLYLDGLENKLLGSISRSLNLSAALEQSLIQDLHAEIVAKKDELGSLQYEYDQAEEDYDAAEAVLVEQEDDENENLDHYDFANQSSHVESEDPASDQVHLHSNNLEELHRQQSRYPPSAFQETDDHREVSGIDELIQNSKSEVILSQEIEAPEKAEKKDSDYDFVDVEAFFKMRVATVPDIPFGDTSRKSTHVDEEANFRNRNRQWESMSHPELIKHDDSAPSGTQYLDSGTKTWSDSGMTIYRKGRIRRRSRVIWWLFDTFGNSDMNYLKRTRDKEKLSSSKHLDDDETWARHVFGYWAGKWIPAAAPVITGATSSTDNRGATHVEDQSLGGSDLLLPSGLSKLKHSVEKVDRLFADTPASPQGLAIPPDLDDELSSMLTPAGNLQSSSCPHLRKLPTQPSLNVHTSQIQLPG